MITHSKFLILIISVIAASTKIDAKHFYSIMTTSAPVKQLFLYKGSSRFFDFDYKHKEADLTSISHEAKFKIISEQNPDEIQVKIYLPKINQYLCWKSNEKSAGVVACDDENSRKATWFLRKKNYGNVYNIGIEKFCLTLGTKDNTKIKNSYYAKTEKCDAKRKKEQDFDLHLLQNREQEENQKEPETESPAKKEEVVKTKAEKENPIDYGKFAAIGANLDKMKNSKETFPKEGRCPLESKKE